MSDFKDKVEIGCVIKAETDKAILCDFGDKEVWIPLSQVDDDSEIWKVGEEGTLVVSEWIATQKGLI